MRKRIPSTLAACLAILLGTATAKAQFYKLETKNLTLIYLTRAHEFIVDYAASCFENSLAFHHNLFGYTPSEKVTLFLQDFSDYYNAGATSAPRNFIRMDLAPADYVFETWPANERMNWTMSHELMHIVSTDQATGRDEVFRTLFFGKVWATDENPTSILYSYLTSPRKLSPRWFLEGLAVFWETWMAGGRGRAQGAYDEMVFRSMINDGSYIYDIIGLESEGTTIDFQLGVNSYLYGTRFISYLAYHYGPEKLIGWVARNQGTKSHFAAQFKQIYGVSLDHEWSRWIEWEHEWQSANLDSIRSNPTTPYRPITNTALGSVSRTFFDPDKNQVYVAINYPGQVAHIAGIDMRSGKIDMIQEVKGAALYYVTSLAYDPATETLFYTTDNNRWRDLNALDLRSRKSKLLMKDVRTGDLVFNKTDRSLWGVRHYNGRSSLVRIPYPYKEWDQMYIFEYGFDILDIDISPDGSTITSALVEPSGQQKLIKMDVAKLVQGETGYDVLFDFDISLPANFVYSDDGRFLYGSSYYSGVSNVFRYDFNKEDMDIISNAETGFFRPVPLADDSLLVFRYSGKGFVPVIIPDQVAENVGAINFLGTAIAEKHPIVRDWILDPPSSINIDSLTTATGRYNTLSNIGMTSAYPIVEGYKDVVGVGMRFNFADKLGLSGFDLTGSYSPDQSLPSDERYHVSLNFHHWSWQLSASLNGADFYDLFGPTKYSRKGYSIGLSYKKNLIFDRPKTLDFNFGVTQYGDMERLPDYQNVASTFDRLLAARVSLNYSFRRSSLGAVDYEKGVKWQLASSGNLVNSKFYPRVHTSLDYGIPLPINHSSIWLRASGGQAFGDRDNPFSNYFFGGFGNNWVDRLEVKRYRDYYSFPGVELNEFGGQNFGKAMIEWILPPIRFRRVGFTSLYFRWARLALFSSAVRVNLDGDKAGDPPEQFGFQRSLVNVGAQLDFRIVMFSRLNSTLSLGYAVAAEENQDLANEFMFSLKIL